jgi:hypothetical protein
VRILIRKSEEGWQVRFPFGNPWKMPAGEWLPAFGPAGETAAAITEVLRTEYRGADIFTIIPIGEDLGQAGA